MHRGKLDYLDFQVIKETEDYQVKQGDRGTRASQGSQVNLASEG